ncbi:MAG: hypothetical protein JWR85_1083 [Marmoricola sp.]|nr:hypothetical protein [Marmoricola sp.]
MTTTSSEDSTPRARLSLLDEPGIRFCAATALLVVTLAAASLAGLDASVTFWVALVVAGLAGAALSVRVSLGLGVITWAVYTGFVENQFGQLTLAGDDLERLVLLMVATVALAGLRRIHRGIKGNSRG